MELFDCIVAAAFVLQIYNLRELGQGRIHYLVMVSIYGLFAVSEAWIAIADDRWSYWMFVTLSSYGALQGVKGYVRERKNVHVGRAVQSSELAQGSNQGNTEEDER